MSDIFLNLQVKLGIPVLIYLFCSIFINYNFEERLLIEDKDRKKRVVRIFNHCIGLFTCLLFSFYLRNLIQSVILFNIILFTMLIYHYMKNRNIDKNLSLISLLVFINFFIFGNSILYMIYTYRSQLLELI